LASVMLTVEPPVARSSVPLPSVAKVFTTQLLGKPLIGTGGPKKQLASPWQLPGRPPQSPSLVHSRVGSETQCLMADRPREQSPGPVPKLAVRLMPSVESKIVVAFSGTCDGATAGPSPVPPPM